MKKQTITIQLVQTEKFEYDEAGKILSHRKEEELLKYDIFEEAAPPNEDIKETNRGVWLEKGLKPSEVEVRKAYPFQK